MEVINPYDHSLLYTVSCADKTHVERAVTSARRGLERSRALSCAERAAILRGAASEVANRSDELASIITAETGKPAKAAHKEVQRCVNTLQLSAEEATRIAGETIPFDSYCGGEDRTGYYFYEPLGVVVAITPFNDPLNLVAHKVGPAIAAGNAVVLKPCEQAPSSAIKLAEILLASGLPKGMINVLTGYGSEFGSQLVAHPDVAMVSFTGGEKTGEIIAGDAGVKKLSMELGANSPVIVMPDADLEKAADACASGANWAAGQNCIGVQRIYVQRTICQRFSELLAKATESLSLGDPRDPQNDVGPMISEHEAQRVERWVDEAKAMGAKVLTGGKREGSLFQPTVLINVPASANIVCKEVFGPVVTVLPFDTLGEAIDLANAHPYSIHAAIFTENIKSALLASRKLEAAGVMINDSTDYRLDAMPFGGARRGSMGREGVKFAVKEMMQTKVVCFNLA